MTNVDPSAIIGNGVKMQESTVIEGDVKIGDNCVFGNKVVIEKHCSYWQWRYNR